MTARNGLVLIAAVRSHYMTVLVASAMGTKDKLNEKDENIATNSGL
jgi:hypothetical protein